MRGNAEISPWHLSRRGCAVIRCVSTRTIGEEAGIRNPWRKILFRRALVGDSVKYTVMGEKGRKEEGEGRIINSRVDAGSTGEAGAGSKAPPFASLAAFHVPTLLPRLHRACYSNFITNTVSETQT